MNINKLFKFKGYPSRTVTTSHGVESFDVIHRDSDDTVMDVTRMAGGHWQAHRNGKTFDAHTRAAAVWGLADRDLGLLTRKLDRNSSATESKAAAIAALEDAIKRFPPITPDMHNGVHDLEALKTHLAILRDGATPMRYK